MRVYRRSIGDLVAARFSVPQNPVITSGMGDFSPAAFSVPQNPFGMGALGCGGSCNGGAACSQCAMGMGDIDLSLTGTGIGDSVGMSNVPNWLLYAAAAGIGYYVYENSSKGRRR
jgi:hypothetical protein